LRLETMPSRPILQAWPKTISPSRVIRVGAILFIGAKCRLAKASLQGADGLTIPESLLLLADEVIE